MKAHSRRRRLALTVTGASTAGVFAVMPAFLVGASATVMREDLAFSATHLGLAVSGFFAVSSVLAALGGRLADRLGARATLSIGSLASGVALLAIAIGARSFAHVTFLLALAGVANGVTQPATNLALASLPTRRKAILFGIKQSAVPVATFLAGASVPLVGATFGWRVPFLVAGATSCLIPLAMWRRRSRGRIARPAVEQPSRGDVPRGRLWALAGAVSLGAASATGLASFLVESLVASGVALRPAGIALAVGSLASIVARIAAGWLSDRTPGVVLRHVGAMLLVGGVGYGLLAMHEPRLALAAAVIAYAFGWGWPGLMMFAAVRLSPRAPARAAGVIQVGAAGGAAIGPVLLGMVIDLRGYPTGWTIAAVMATLSGVLVLAIDRHEPER